MGKVICCCSAECWTKVISVIQIITSGVYAVMMLGLIVMVLISGKDKVEEILRDNPAIVTLGGSGVGYTTLMVTVLISLAFTCFNFFMGVILFKGAKQRNLKYLLAWQVMTVMILIAYVAVEVLVRNTSILNTVVYFIFLFLWTIFFVWIVQVFKRDIVIERETEADES